MHRFCERQLLAGGGPLVTPKEFGMYCSICGFRALRHCPFWCAPLLWSVILWFRPHRHADSEGTVRPPGSQFGRPRSSFPGEFGYECYLFQDLDVGGIGLVGCGSFREIMTQNPPSFFTHYAFCWCTHWNATVCFSFSWETQAGDHGCRVLQGPLGSVGIDHWVWHRHGRTGGCHGAGHCSDVCSNLNVADFSPLMETVGSNVVCDVTKVSNNTARASLTHVRCQRQHFQRAPLRT